MASQLGRKLEVLPWPIRPGTVCPLAIYLISSPAAFPPYSFHCRHPGLLVLQQAFSWLASACNLLLNVCVASLLPHSVLGSDIMPSARSSLVTVSKIAPPPPLISSSCLIFRVSLITTSHYFVYLIINSPSLPHTHKHWNFAYDTGDLISFVYS